METLAFIHLTLDHESLTPDLQGDSSVSAHRFTQNSVSFSSLLGLNLISVMVSLILGSLTSLAPDIAYAQTAILRQGSVGDDVTEIQSRLGELGYFDVDPTGFFGPITTEAVLQFQADNGLLVDGIVGPETTSALFRVPTPAPTAAVPQVVSPVVDLSDSATARLQEDLAELGYYQGAIDGIYGPLTEVAVRTFQLEQGLVADGTVGVETLAAIQGALNAQRTRSPVAVVPETEGSGVFLQNDSETIAVQQNANESRIVVQQEPQRTFVETIGSTTPLIVAQGPSPSAAPLTVTQPAFIPPTTVTQTYPLVTTPQPIAPASTSNLTFAQPQVLSVGPYIVAVPDRNVDTLANVRQFYPTANLDGSNRGAFVNAGSYVQREQAESASRFLRQQGLDARVIFRPR